MLFNSFEFALVYLPLAMGGFFGLGRWPKLAAAFLGAASVVFYGYWSLAYVPLLLGSVAGNFVAGLLIVRYRQRARAILAVAIAANLLLLAYFKYADFFIATANLGGAGLPLLHVALPIGISFFTFTQIAFLVDTYKGQVKEFDVWHYLLFVTYFPHLIAGPVLHHAQMMPQFAKSEIYRLQPDKVATGLFFFVVGLMKKVLLADTFGAYARPVFEAAQQGADLGPAIAWTGALAYTLQIYFDFSGYSDMAVGLSLLFGVTIPFNFNSPYKSPDIIEFWRRWHMTLSQFLRDYLYIPLGGNRFGELRRYVNLLATMLLGGLWHGASWTFVAWGGLHGAYLIVAHLWRKQPLRLPAPVGVALTTLAVIVAWVFFRAPDFPTAARLLSSMFDLGAVGASLGAYPEALSRLSDQTAEAGRLAAWLATGFVICWMLPNTQEIAERGRRFLEMRRWWLIGAETASVFLVLLINAAQGVSEFIYFNF